MVFTCFLPVSSHASFVPSPYPRKISLGGTTSKKSQVPYRGSGYLGIKYELDPYLCGMCLRNSMGERLLFTTLCIPDFNRDFTFWGSNFFIMLLSPYDDSIIQPHISTTGPLFLPVLFF